MEYFEEANALFDKLSQYSFSIPRGVDDFAKWLVGEESMAYKEAKDDRNKLYNQCIEDIRAQDDEQIKEVVAWLTGYMTAKNIDTNY